MTVAVAALFGERPRVRRPPVDELYGVRLYRDEDAERWETDRDAIDGLYDAIGTTR